VKAFYLSDYSLRGAHDRAFGQAVSWDVDLLAGYEAVFVAGAAQREEATGFFSMLAPGLWDAIAKAPLDALVVHGHTPAAMLVGIAAAKARGLPVFMRGETHLGLARSGLKARLRAPLMRAFYARLDGMLAIGTANHAFYRAMGVPEAKIFRVPYTVDNARFTAASQLSPEARAERRRFLGAADARPIVLYAAKFQDRKRPADLVRAAAEMERAGARFHLAMVGAGELEGELKALAAELRLAGVSFPGFVNQSGLPALYGAADVFVLASENEPWGLAINEAMCAGLPVVTTDAVGAAADLVRDGVNGAVIAAGDVGALAAALAPMLADADLRRRMGAASADIVSRWSYAECRAGLVAALASVGLAGQPAQAA
jgi:glycosyltransferase involved in cell wall biosynthesis